MPMSRRARLATAGLAATLLAPVVVLAPAHAVSPYSSCAEVQFGVPTALDGEYEITVFGKTLDVYCADMATDAPVEYLTLQNVGSAFNYGQSSWNNAAPGIRQTNYTRLRLNVPTSSAGSFSVSTTDNRFSTSTGTDGTQPYVAYGSTGSCQWRSTAANLDLRMTPFAMSTSDFTYGGWLPGGTITASSNNQVIDIANGRGDCGGVGANDPLPLTWLHSLPSATDPADQEVVSGQDATFTASSTGSPTPTVQWQSSTDGTTWTDVAGATSTTLTRADVTLSDDGTWFRAVFTNNQGTDTTAAAQLTVTPFAPAVTDPADTTVGSGGDATFSVTVTGDPAPTVQWEWSTDGTTWTAIDGATSPDLVVEGVTTADDGLMVRAVASSTAGTATSETATLSVDGIAPTVTGPSDTTVTSGEDATFSVEVAGDPAPTIAWEWSLDGTTWTTIDGATGTDLVLTEVTTEDDALMVRAQVTSAAGTATSEPATLTVLAAAPVITTAPTATTVDAGEDATFSVTATGDPSPTYQWQTSTDNTVWTDITGATGATLTLDEVTAAQDGLWVRVYVANSGGASASEGVQLTVLSPAPAAPGAPAAPIDAPAPALPATGATTQGLTALAGALLVAGAGALVVARRRQSV